MSKDEQIFKLWKLLDDIDTALDMYKTDYRGFQQYATRRVGERHKVTTNEQLDELFRQFHSSQESKKEGK